MSIHRLFQCGLKSPKYSNHRQKAIPYIAVFQSLRSLRTATPSGPTPPGTAAYFNPRGPCGLRRPLVWPRPGPPPVFQSLRSLRTATIRRNPSILRPGNFNPRGPCGPRRGLRSIITSRIGISILAVLADRDWCAIVNFELPKMHFNPRGPCGPRQDAPEHFWGDDGISILAVLADRDVKTFLAGGGSQDFNPRGPCGPRRRFVRRSIRRMAFQSSRSLRTATRKRYPKWC